MPSVGVISMGRLSPTLLQGLLSACLWKQGEKKIVIVLGHMERAPHTNPYNVDQFISETRRVIENFKTCQIYTSLFSSVLAGA